VSVTVGIVCLNAAPSIADAIDSVVAQIDDVHQLVIVDGGSGDGTIDIIAAAESRLAGKLAWVSEPDGGIYDAMNNALARATASHVLFLGADDLLGEGALRSILDVGTEPDLIYGDAHVVQRDGRRQLRRAVEVPRLVSGIPWTMPNCHQACVFSADAYRRLEGFNTRFRIAGDYEFYLRFFAANLTSVRVCASVTDYALQGVSSRSGLATADEYRLARVMNGMSPTLARAFMLRSLLYWNLARAVRTVRHS